MRLLQTSMDRTTVLLTTNVGISKVGIFYIRICKTSSGQNSVAKDCTPQGTSSEGSSVDNGVGKVSAIKVGFRRKETISV